MGAGRGKNRLSGLISWALKSYLTSLSLTFFCKKGVVTVLTWQGHCVTHIRSNGNRAHTLWVFGKRWPSWLPWGLEQLQKPECLGAEPLRGWGLQRDQLPGTPWVCWVGPLAQASAGFCLERRGREPRNSAGCSQPAWLPTPCSELFPGSMQLPSTTAFMRAGLGGARALSCLNSFSKRSGDHSWRNPGRGWEP